jgi:hypothetical protein
MDMSEPSQHFRRGSGDGMYEREIKRNTGSPNRWRLMTYNRNPAREGWVDWGGGEARSTCETGQCRWREGASVQGNVERSKGQEIGVNLKTPERVQKLQTALHTKAKESPGYRLRHFTTRYTERTSCRLRMTVVEPTHAAGVDDQSFEDITSYGATKWLGELTEELRNERYRPQAVRRVHIPKPNGSKRPLGIPTIRDRVAQMAACWCWSLYLRRTCSGAICVPT